MEQNAQSDQSSSETLSFKSELRQVLHLITHSLYSHKEVFFRELLSNASDAIDKARFNSLDNEALAGDDRDWKIRVTADKTAGTLTISDNGIGMTRSEIVENLGTIAKSGTRAFIDQLKTVEAAQRPELIGQFGVGFYSAFMVADRVRAVSRALGASEAVAWESDGQGEFTIQGAEREGRGTDVILYLKETEKDFLDTWRIRNLVKQFSDFIEHPIVMAVETKNGESAKTEDETLNSRMALWLRSKQDITQNEYESFYHQISSDFDSPAKVLHIHAEGSISFKALLFLPKRKSWDLQLGETKGGPRLYINRVLIQDPCEALLPQWLRFVKGVVDCPDLPLNVSRETLQQNPLVDKIQKNLTKQVMKALEELKTDDRAAFEALFRELGQFIKEGIARDYERREAIADLLLFEHVNGEPGHLIALGEYLDAIKEPQNEIYHLCGEDRAALAANPCLEAFRHLNWDVLLLTDPMDPFVMPSLTEFKGKALKAADRHAPEMPEARRQLEEATQAYRPLLDCLKSKLTTLRDVRLSTRMKESAACLVAAEDAMDPRVEQLMARIGQGHGASPRVLELNPEHPTVKALFNRYQASPDDPIIEQYGHFLADQALIAEGSRLPNPAAFLARVNEMAAKLI
ncbi:MAG: molecular chaperone HtpG [Holophagales bacterium]|jgi:molecular chaperone HtpG|nr:molecular chaperone HtpG [Holophagales bacterium]